MVFTTLFTDALWYVVSILSPVVIVIAGCINQKFNIHGDLIKGVIAWRQVVAMLVSAALVIGSYFIGWTPELGEPLWLSLLMAWVIITAVAGWGYDIKAIKTWIGTWFAR